MTTKDEPIIVEQTYNASVDRVWTAITDIDQMKKWFFENIDTFKAEVGFETQVQLQKKIIYNWKYGGYSGNSYVSWELSKENNLTRLKLTHDVQEAFTK